MRDENRDDDRVIIRRKLLESRRLRDAVDPDQDDTADAAARQRPQWYKDRMGRGVTK